MKKAFLIFFVLMIAAGSCFAANEDKLILTTTIAKEKPEFSMEGNTVLGTQTGGQVVVTSPVAGNVEVEMVVKQIDDARYKGAFSISVTATALSNTDTTTYPGQATSAPTVSTLLSQVTNGTDFVVTASESANVVTLAMDYKTGSKVAKCDVATWKFVWAQAPNLAEGTYQGTVTLNYTAP